VTCVRGLFLLGEDILSFMEEVPSHAVIGRDVRIGSSGWSGVAVAAPELAMGTRRPAPQLPAAVYVTLAARAWLATCACVCSGSWHGVSLCH